MGEKKVLDLQAQNYVLMMSTYIYSFKVIKCGSQLLIYMTTHLSFPPLQLPNNGDGYLFPSPYLIFKTPKQGEGVNHFPPLSSSLLSYPFLPSTLISFQTCKYSIHVLVLHNQ